jgi:hypothetical protein
MVNLDLTSATDLRIANVDALALRIANVDVWTKSEPFETHTIFDNTMPYTASSGSDGEPIWTGVIAYVVPAQTPQWKLLGTRHYVSAESLLEGTMLNVGYHIGSGPDIIGTDPDDTPEVIVASWIANQIEFGPLVLGWNDFLFDTPVEIPAVNSLCSLSVGSSSSTNRYSAVSGGVVGSDPVQAVDGSPLYLPDSSERRGVFGYPNSSSYGWSFQGAYYFDDVLMGEPL